MLKMFTEQKTFNYEQPEMTYDKKTGNVTIIDPRDKHKKKKRIITNVDEVEEMKTKLYEELGLDQDGLPTEEDTSKINIEDLGERLKTARNAFKGEFDYDPANFYQFTRDMMRVDIGLMI